jgi:drug/metabolite transporter (DMT)-like permease
VLIAGAAIGFGVGTALSGGSRILPARPEEIVAAAAVLFCGLAALTAFDRGIGAVTASRAGLLFSLQPVAGALTGVSLLGEPLGGAEAVRGALIVVRVLLAGGRSHGEDRRPPRDRQAAGAVTGHVRQCTDCS